MFSGYNPHYTISEQQNLQLLASVADTAQRTPINLSRAYLADFVNQRNQRILQNNSNINNNRMSSRIGVKMQGLKRISESMRNRIKNFRGTRLAYPNKAPAPSVVAANQGFLRNKNQLGMKQEKKVIDINAAAYAVEQTGTVLILANGCIAGSQNFNRIGRKISLKSLQIRGFLQPTDFSTNATLARMLVIFDKQANGAAPTFANIVTSQNIAGTTSSVVTDMVNLDNRDRFEVIRDKMFVLGRSNNTATQTSDTAFPLIVEEYIKLGNREVVYNAGTAGTVGDIQSGSLYVIWISSEANASGVTFNGSFRLRFLDQ